MGTISFRKGFRWLDASPPPPISEPTSTIVLTAPSHLFVDVRVFNSSTSPVSASSTSFPVTDAKFLDWAIAGTSESQPTGPDTCHSKWHHWVSSREITTDEGDMDPHPDGNGLVRELGCMLNPETGKSTPYEEVWDDREHPKGEPCMVLRYEDQQREERGLCIMLAGVCQAVARTDEGIQVEQWRSVEENQKHEQTVKIGSLETPCEDVWRDRVAKEKGSLWKDSRGREWSVVEV